MSRTSLAGSATLGENKQLTTELTSWNLPDYQFCLESKTELIVAKAKNCIFWGGGGTKQKKLGGVITAHSMLRRETIGYGTTHKTGLNPGAGGETGWYVGQNRF